MKHIRKGIAISCMLALLMQLFVAFPAASADTVAVRCAFAPATSVAAVVGSGFILK